MVRIISLITAFLFYSSHSFALGVLPGSNTSPSSETPPAGISDNFSTDTAANYTKIRGSGTLLVSSGVATATPAYRDVEVYHNTSVGSVDQYVQSQFIHNAGGGTDTTFLLARVNESGGYNDYYRIYGSDTNLAVVRVVDGTGTYVTSASAVLTDQVSTLCRVEVTGTDPVNIKIYLGGSGTPTINYNDSNAARLQTGTYVGMGADHLGQGQIGVIVVDDFAAGAL